MRDVLLEIRDLRTHFFTEDGIVKAINGVNLEIARGETLGLVGESGSGKSVTALSILRLIQDPPGKIVSGQLLFRGDDLLTYSMSQLRRDIRGREIAMIFQDPMISLNPVFTVGNQLAEAIYLHQFKDQRAALRQGVAMLREAGAPRAGRTDRYQGRASRPFALAAGDAEGDSDDGSGGDPFGQGPGDRLPPSVLRGDAATHHDRHGHLVPALAPYRR